ncbi:MAG: hypothetical protein HOV80_01820 [Polyangiaceae bacterium]|nr:hypothetical protein [Polyangiaceae bacterium]
MRMVLCAALLAGCAHTETVTSQLTVFETLRREESAGVVARRLVPLADGGVLVAGSVDGPFVADGRPRTCGDGGSLFLARLDGRGSSKFFGCTSAPAMDPYLGVTNDKIYLVASTRTGAGFASARDPGPFQRFPEPPPDEGEVAVALLDLEGTPLSRSVVAPGSISLRAAAVTPKGDAAVALLDRKVRVVVGSPPGPLVEVESKEVDWPPSSTRLVLHPQSGFVEATIQDRVVTVRRLEASGRVLWTWSRSAEAGVHVPMPYHLELAAQPSGGVLVGVTLRDNDERPKKEVGRAEVIRLDEKGKLRGTTALRGGEEGRIFGLAPLEDDRFAVLFQLWSDGAPIKVDLGSGPTEFGSDAAVVVGIDPAIDTPMFIASLAGRTPADHALGYDVVSSGDTLHVVGWLSGDVVGDQRYRTSTNVPSGFWWRVTRQR